MTLCVLMCSCEAWSTWMAHWMQRPTLNFHRGCTMTLTRHWVQILALRWDAKSFICFYAFSTRYLGLGSCFGIEAMAKKYLGDTLDIHGGGLGNQADLADLADFCLERAATTLVVATPANKAGSGFPTSWKWNRTKSTSQELSAELWEFEARIWISNVCRVCASDRGNGLVRWSSQWPDLCQNVDALRSCVGSYSGCEIMGCTRVYPGAPRLCRTHL